MGNGGNGDGLKGTGTEVEGLDMWVNLIKVWVILTFSYVCMYVCVFIYIYI